MSMHKGLRGYVREVGAYGAASAIAFAVDFGLLALLVKRAGLGYLPAAALSFVGGALVLYALAVSVVFRFRRIENRVFELSYFIVIGVAGLLVNMLVMAAVVELVHLHFLVAKVLAAGCTFGANFLLRRKLLFSPAPQTE